MPNRLALAPTALALLAALSLASCGKPQPASEVAPAAEAAAAAAPAPAAEPAQAASGKGRCSATVEGQTLDTETSAILNSFNAQKAKQFYFGCSFDDKHSINVGLLFRPEAGPTELTSGVLAHWGEGSYSKLVSGTATLTEVKDVADGYRFSAEFEFTLKELNFGGMTADGKAPGLLTLKGKAVDVHVIDLKKALGGGSNTP